MDPLIIVALATPVSAFAVAWLAGHQRRADKKQQWEREDEVAKRLVKIEGKVDEVHILTNSNMTASKQAELDATVLSLAMINEVLCLQKLAGHEPGVDTLANLEAAQTKIAGLRKEIAERKIADEAVAAKQAATRKEVAEL